MRDSCYLLKARKASQAAHLVIVNHSLLFSDTETDNRILGEYSYLICDEAHNMEQVATEHLGRRSSVWRARAMLDNLYRDEGGQSGDLGEIVGALAGGEGALLESAVAGAERLASDITVASAASEAFFAALRERHKDLNDGREVEFGKLRYRQEAPVAALLEDELGAVLAAMSTVAQGAASLADLITDSELERADAFVQNLTFHAARISEFGADLEYVAEAADPESVFWLDVRTFRDVFECELRSAPVSVAEMMGDFLYSKVDSLIATSATMTVDGSFDFVMERLGLDLIPDWKVLTLDVGSPYDYDAQSIAVVAGYLQQPSSSGFNQTVGRLVVKLAERAQGGTLVLFTARSALDAVFKAVVDPLTARGKLVLAQGHGGAASSLLEQFAREVDSVLLATSSFWEGVDVPGRSLEQLVIVKLPFPVPRDPVVEAHCERYEADGENSFGRYMIPRTAIRLRQGFGRLIRSTTDSGAVIFLDSRLSTRAYGERLLEQLPTTYDHRGFGNGSHDRSGRDTRRPVGGLSGARKAFGSVLPEVVFMDKKKAGPREVRAPRGTGLSCKGWLQEAALRMITNNLDPEVAENPDELVVYGGTGKAARNWDAFEAIVRSLKDARARTRRCSCSRASPWGSSGRTPTPRGC